MCKQYFFTRKTKSSMFAIRQGSKYHIPVFGLYRPPNAATKIDLALFRFVILRK